LLRKLPEEVGFYYFYDVDHKKTKNTLFLTGIVIGIVVGVLLHAKGMGIAFGVIIGLAMRETYERNYWRRRNKDQW
jgi:hypothetical protein